MEVRFPIIGNGPEIDVAKAAMSFRWAASASLDPAVKFVLPFIGKQRLRRLSLLNPAARFNVRCKLRKCLRRRAHVQAMSVAVGISRRSNHNLRADFDHAIWWDLEIGSGIL
jgi:hypothetical protein